MTWNLTDGLGAARLLEPIAILNGYHVALGGSVLHQGSSEKDCDLILYKRTKAKTHTNIEQFVTSLSEVGFTIPTELANDSSGGPQRPIYKLEFFGKRVDLIFVLDEDENRGG